MKPVQSLDSVDSLRAHRGTVFSTVYAAMAELELGQALPVECSDLKEAMSLQYGVLSRNSRYDQKYRAQRRGVTVYISKVESKKP